VAADPGDEHIITNDAVHQRRIGEGRRQLHATLHIDVPLQPAKLYRPAELHVAYAFWIEAINGVHSRPILGAATSLFEALDLIR
jgi:hypothetical protein